MKLTKLPEALRKKAVAQKELIVARQAVLRAAQEPHDRNLALIESLPRKIEKLEKSADPFNEAGMLKIATLRTQLSVAERRHPELEEKVRDAGQELRACLRPEIFEDVLRDAVDDQKNRIAAYLTKVWEPNRARMMVNETQVFQSFVYFFRFDPATITDDEVAVTEALRMLDCVLSGDVPGFDPSVDLK